MAKELAERGHTVLTFDFRGFGESEDPRRYETFSDLDFVHDVSSALSYVSALQSVESVEGICSWSLLRGWSRRDGGHSG